jgi:serine/threonine-protein kinase
VLPAAVPDGAAAVAATGPSAGATTAVLAGVDHTPAESPLRRARARVSTLIGSRLPAGRRDRALWLAAAAFALLVVGASVFALLTTGNATKDAPDPGQTTTSPRAPVVAKVKVDPAAYIGKRATDVRAALAALGLKTTVHQVSNPGGRSAGTVAALRPTGRVAKGTTVTVDVWGAPPKVENDGPTKHKPGKGHGKGKGKH